MYVFGDLETTGLDESVDVVIEAAFVATDAFLNPYDEISIVIGQENPDWHFLMNSYVTEMHRKSGLTEEVHRSGIGLLRAEAFILEWFDQIGMPRNEIPLAGSTIDFDRKFLRRHMPTVEQQFHYRSLNVSSLKIVVNDWAPLEARWPSVPDDQKAHRARPDVLASIAELKHYKTHVFDKLPNRHSVDL